jgi:uncharacterized damage-inducible protein DinB
MQLYHSLQTVFVQLNDSLQQLSDKQYTQPSARLFHASIGQHVRHIIELFICLQKGYNTGVINYEKRKRELLIETDKEFARELLTGILQSINKPDKVLLLEANYNEESEETLLIETNYYREIVYNLEHTVHHMALIRVGINEVSSIDVPNEFGVAASTIKYKKTVCAQ